MGRLALLDYARFFAALSVVFYHYFFNGIYNGKVTSIQHTDIAPYLSYGHYGVQFFFIISGYVIFYSLKGKGATSFAKSRLKRLYPTYWFAILFTSLFAVLWGAGTEMAVTLKQVVINFSMFQFFLNVPNVDGVYWTLMYEIIFYGIVFLLLMFFDFKKLLIFLIAWPVLIIVANLFGKTFLIFNIYFSFFIIGSMFALLKNGVLPKKIVLLALSLASVLGFYQMYQAGIAKHHDTIIVFIIFAAMMLFFYCLNVDKYRSIELPASQAIGGMTYPLYLIHAHFGYMFLNKFANPSNYIMVYSILLSIVLIMAWMLWYFIEIRQANFWHKFFTFTTKPIEKIETRLRLDKSS